MKSGLVFLLIALMAAGCNIDYKKTKSGLPYKIIRGNGTKTPGPGSFLKFQLYQTVDDSITFDTRDKLPFYFRVIDFDPPYSPYGLFRLLKDGDSLIIAQSVDSLIKYNGANLPDAFRKSQILYTYFKVIDVFPSDSLSNIDKDKEGKLLLGREINDVAAYIQKNKINAKKEGEGVYVEVIETGQGPELDSGKTAMVYYKGSDFSGRVFETNMDTVANNAGPMAVALGGSGVIRGFDQGLQSLRVGSRAKIYVPSMLAYGATPDPSTGIKPFDHLIFEVYVKDVKNIPPPQTLPTQKIDTAQKK